MLNVIKPMGRTPLGTLVEDKQLTDNGITYTGQLFLAV
jgi:hypothetical protein